MATVWVLSLYQTGSNIAKGFPQQTLHASQSLVTFYTDVLQAKCHRVYNATGRDGPIFKGVSGSHKVRGWLLAINYSVFLEPVTFQMDELAYVKEALEQGMWVTSLDMSEVVPFYTNQQRSDKVCLLNMEHKICASRLSVWPHFDLVSIHGGQKVNQTMGSRMTNDTILVAGRLAKRSQPTETSNSEYANSRSNMSRNHPTGERGKCKCAPTLFTLCSKGERLDLTTDRVGAS